MVRPLSAEGETVGGVGVIDSGAFMSASSNRHHDFQRVAARIVGHCRSQGIEEGIVGRGTGKAKNEHTAIVQQQPEPRLIVAFAPFQRCGGPDGAKSNP